MQPLRVPRWILLLLWALAAGYAAYVAWTIGEGYRSAARGEMPLYTDYTPRYAASLLLQAAPAEYLYVPQAMIEAGREAARAIYGELSPEQLAGVGFAAWMFPPTFMLAVYPLALLPYWLSWIAWLAATAVPYLAAMRRILPAPLALPFALALPPTFYNVMYGQTGFLVGGLIALGLSQLGPRPWLAGVLIGLASVKPHFGVLIPLALLAGGCWRTFAAAALTVIALAGASLLAFGDEPWFAFIGSFLFHAEGLGVGAFNFVPMTSVLSAFRLAGASMAQAWQAQYLAAAAMALLVVWAWWRSRGLPRAHGLRCAMLCLATPLAIPMSYLYDLVLIAPAAAWLLADLLSRPRRTWELPLLTGALAAFLAVKPLARAELQLGTLLVAVLLGMTLRRFHGLCRERHG